MEMDIRMEKGCLRYIDDCCDALINSELGRRYFANEGSAHKAIQEGLGCGNLYVALYNDICVGFVWYITNGAFHSFPYLHIISVKEEYRGKGIGKKMMDFVEDIILKNDTKLFLVVADFNPEAKRFYEKLGYKQVGSIPNLYRNGTTEYIMMKEKFLI